MQLGFGAPDPEPHRDPKLPAPRPSQEKKCINSFRQGNEDARKGGGGQPSMAAATAAAATIIIIHCIRMLSGCYQDVIKMLSKLEF